MHNSIKAYALLALLFLLPIYAPPGAAAGWQLSDFTVANGSAEDAAQGLRLTPDASGKIYLTLDVEGVDLDKHSLLRIDAESSMPLQYFLLWKTVTHGDQLFQFRVETSAASGEPIVMDMAGRNRWEGEATMVGLGLFAPGRREVLLREFELHSPGLAYDARSVLAQWTSFLPWQAPDSNFYTGTTGYREGLHPAPLFAGLFFVCVAAYALVLLASGRLRAFNWHVVGGLALALWITVDLLWLQRLGARALDTLEHRAGTSVEEKLLATRDAPVYSLVKEVKPLIGEPDARVFVASDSDFHGMLGAYYLTPLNTFWPRSGRELPHIRYIRPGDYLLLVRPTFVPFDTQRNVVIFPGDEEVAVEPLHISALGGLLRVL